MVGIAEPVLVGDYLGCYGRVEFDAPEMPGSFARASFGERPVLPRSAVQAVQWMRSGARGQLLQPAPQECLLLYGPVTGPVTLAWARRVSAMLKEGCYTDLASIPGELSGCLVTPRKLFLFRSVADSMEGLLYRRNGSLLRWSTDPTDLLDHNTAEFDREAIWRCCRGDDLLIYRNLTPLLPGQVVIADEKTTTTVQFDRITPMDLPRRTSLAEYAEIAWELIRQAVRPFANQGRIGVMLSGGLDSVTVLTALAEVGADVIAYHHTTRHVDVGEYPYAKAACDHLGVPLASVEMDLGEGYLSEDWLFPHPYPHIGFRHWEQIADRARDDRLTYVTWGRDGDVTFGPLRYGLHTILAGDLPWRERAALAAGLVSTGWSLPNLARSILPSSSLFYEELPFGENAFTTDFLAPLPDAAPVSWSNADYIAQQHVLNLALWWPRGIQLCSPLGSKDIRRLVARMPHAYRMLPYRGRLITKPVLRLILSTRLPSAVWRRYGRGWYEMPHKNYALAHPGQLADLIGRPDSHLVELGVVDRARLGEVLADRRLRQWNTVALICSAMAELFLRNHHERVRAMAPTVSWKSAGLKG